jgi:hypothetical protein
MTWSTAASRAHASCFCCTSSVPGEGYPPNSITQRNIRGLRRAKCEAHEAPRPNPIKATLSKDWLHLSATSNIHKFGSSPWPPPPEDCCLSRRQHLRNKHTNCGNNVCIAGPGADDRCVTTGSRSQPEI